MRLCLPLRALGFLDRNQLKKSQQVFSMARPTTQTLLVIKKVMVGGFLASMKSLTKQVSRISPFLEDSSDLRVLIAGGSEVFVLNDELQ